MKTRKTRRKPPPPPIISLDSIPEPHSGIYISCGGGRQSTAMALMAIHGDLGVDIQGILFADTGWESEHTYENIDFLTEYSRERQGPPVVIVENGHIRKDTLDPTKRSPAMPIYIHTDKVITAEDQLAQERGRQARQNEEQLDWLEPEWIHEFERQVEKGNVPEIIDRGRTAILMRQCTADYKIKPVYDFIKSDTKVRLGKSCHAARPAYTCVGITMDEVTRVKPSSVQYINNMYPLIAKRMTTTDCLAYMDGIGYPLPSRSACIGCPYHSNEEWKRIKDESPSEFEDACEFDEKLREQGLTHPRHPDGKFVNRIYLHNSMKPLREADFENDTEDFLQQEDCEGGCFL